MIRHDVLDVMPVMIAGMQLVLNPALQESCIIVQMQMGTVGHNQKKCIDCGTCTWACLTHCLEFRVLEENEVPYFRPLLSKVCETGRWRRYGI